jgi:glycosyltransferase involved in cell wall biosynthesis
MTLAVLQKPVPVAPKTSRIVCCVPPPSDRWLQLIAHESTPRYWYVCHDHPCNRLEKWLPRRWRGILTSWRAIQTAKQHQATILITADPDLSLWCSVFAILERVKVYHIAWSFHFLKLPQGPLCWLMQWAYPKIQQFVVHSRMDQHLYGDYFAIPSGRFDRIHWGATAPAAIAIKPLITGDYACAVVRSRRDCQTLIAALERLPHLRVVVIAEQYCLRGLSLPANLIPQTNLSSSTRLNILQYSCFLVLPLSVQQSTCDYDLMVTAMQLGKAIVTAELPCTSDYAFHNSNALLYPPQDTEALTQAMQKLWSDREKCHFLGSNGKGFADTFCSETALQNHFHKLLVRKGL